MLLATYIAYNKILRMFAITYLLKFKKTKQRSTTFMKENVNFLNAHLKNFFQKLCTVLQTAIALLFTVL